MNPHAGCPIRWTGFYGRRTSTRFQNNRSVPGPRPSASQPAVTLTVKPLPPRYNFRFHGAAEALRRSCEVLMSKAVEIPARPLRLAERMSRLGTETAFEVLVKARALEAQGRDIVHLEIGEPDFDTPGNVVEAGVAALRKGWTHYGPSAGLPQLRQAIAEDAGRRRGISIEPDEVVVVPGGKPIMFFAILALVEAADEVIYPNPGFPIYQSMIE